MHQIFTEMKKLTLIFTAICALFLTSCENPAKSRIYTEEGSKLLLRYSEYKKAVSWKLEKEAVVNAKVS